MIVLGGHRSTLSIIPALHPPTVPDLLFRIVVSIMCLKPQNFVRFFRHGAKSR